MKENLLVSDRGQITLPAQMRRALGLGPNTVVTAEKVGGKIVLSPAVVLETESYTEQQIAGWDKEDRLGRVEKDRLRKKLGK